MADELNAQGLRKMTDELIASISSPQFVEAMKRMKQTPMDKRLDFASKNLTPSVLSKAGVKFPSGMRITSRYFEPGSADIIEIDERGARLSKLNTLPSGAMAAWACACGGTLTTCGGAGGGS